jgi:hypothetical protein
MHDCIHVSVPCNEKEKLWEALFAGWGFHNSAHNLRICKIVCWMFTSFSFLQISPFPYDLVKKECAKYPNATLCWAQEEAKNQGSWTYVQPRFNTTLNGSRDIR